MVIPWHRLAEWWFSLRWQVYGSSGYLLDPHTAVGVAAALKLQQQGRALSRDHHRDDEPVFAVGESTPVAAAP
jgi:hypothetical protein